MQGITYSRFKIKTVYSRLVIILVVTMIIATVVLGVLLNALFNNQYRQDRLILMQRESQEIQKLLKIYENPDSREVAQAQLRVIARQYNGSIWVFNLDGSQYLEEADREKRDEWQYFEPNNKDREYFNLACEDIFSGNKIENIGNFFGYCEEKIFTYGCPWIDEDGIIKGAIFFNTKLKDLNDSLIKITLNVVNASIIALSFAFILASITVRQVTKPIIDMNTVVRSYAKGDFSSRVEVDNIDEIGQLADSVNVMAEELKGMDNMRKSFVANVSHELKAPLASMRGFVQLVLDNDPPKADREEYLTIVHEETVRLNGLINDLLDISKMESGKDPLNITSFDINEVIRRSLITFDARIEERNINIDIKFSNDKCFVDGDKDRMTQVIRNLIDNAIKYSDIGAEITLISFENVEKSRAYITVKDTGYGIPEEDLPHIFERFYKVDKAHTPGVDGTGLGLSIIKFIIEQHDSQIHIFSKYGKGTSICFWLKMSDKKGTV